MSYTKMMTKKRPLLSLITVTHQPSAETVQRYVAMVQDAPPEVLEWVIVDSGSGINVLKTLEERLGSVGARVFSFPDNVGFGAGCNLGAKQATSAAFFFLNPDAVIDRSSWPLILRRAEQITLGELPIVQPLVLRSDGRGVDTAGELLLSGGGSAKLYEWQDSADCVRQSAWLQENFFDKLRAGPSGAAFLISRDTFESIGAFDEDFFLMKEDSDLALRLLHQGVRTLFDPQIVVRHEVSATVDRRQDLKTYFVIRNQILLIFKNWSALEWFFFFPLFLVHCVLLVAYHAYRRRRGTVKALLAGFALGMRKWNTEGRFFMPRLHWLASPFPVWFGKVKRLKGRS